MADITRFRIQQIVDNGQIVQLALAEDVQTEPVSQKQMILDSVAKKLDPELREHEQTTISITMPRGRYERMGRPQVGEILDITILKSK